MNKKLLKKIKLVVILVFIVCIIWFAVVLPLRTFHTNEEKLENAARRYFEIESNQLPTGERIKTVTLQQLYHKSYVEGDIFVPYTNKPCSVKNSWVKVRRENGEYKYYTYLECGVLSSKIDHKGPTIQLNGKDVMTVGLGEEFKDPGVKSVVDDSDGKLDVKDVTVKGTVNTSEIGSYEISYIAFDSFSNKTQVKREINVVQKLNSTIKKVLNGSNIFTGDPENNYIRLSNMLFRIYGLNSKNDVIVVADEDIANVNHTKIDAWLDYYYDHLMDTTKELIVKQKYCNMNVSDDNLNATKCNGFTDEKYVYIPSIVEVNSAASEDNNYMKPFTMSWVANKKASSQDAYLTRKFFYFEYDGHDYMSYPATESYGVRPMFTIKGDTLLVDGDGTREKPYSVGDSKNAKYGSLLHDRYSGEYVYDSGTLWRIVEPDEDGTTKVISNGTIESYNETASSSIKLTVFPGPGGTIYNPKDINSVGYFINNTVTGYVDTSNLDNHVIQVPIYKKYIIFGEEVEKKEYKAVLSAPNLFEMFSAQPASYTAADTASSYWLINSSKSKDIMACITVNGVPYTTFIDREQAYGVRVVGYFKKDVTIVGGKGTFYDPYKIK